MFWFDFFSRISFLHHFLYQVFDDWNKGELESFLVEITRDILKFRDADGTFLLDKIRDSAGQVGGATWSWGGRARLLWKGLDRCERG